MELYLEEMNDAFSLRKFLNFLRLPEENNILCENPDAPEIKRSIFMRKSHVIFGDEPEKHKYRYEICERGYAKDGKNTIEPLGHFILEGFSPISEQNDVAHIVMEMRCYGEKDFEKVMNILSKHFPEDCVFAKEPLNH